MYFKYIKVKKLWEVFKNANEGLNLYGRYFSTKFAIFNNNYFSKYHFSVAAFKNFSVLNTRLFESNTFI